MCLAEEEVVAGEDEVEAFGGGGAGLALAEVAGVCEGGGGDGLLGEMGGEDFCEIIFPAEGVDAAVEAAAGGEVAAFEAEVAGEDGLAEGDAVAEADEVRGLGVGEGHVGALLGGLLLVNGDFEQGGLAEGGGVFAGGAVEAVERFESVHEIERWVDGDGVRVSFGGAVGGEVERVPSAH